MVKWDGELRRRDPEVVVVESDGHILNRRATLFLSVGSFVLSLFFLSQNITGNAVANFSISGANWIGGVLFILAILGALVYVQESKR